MNPQPDYFCPVCNHRFARREVIGPNLDGHTVPMHGGEFEHCDGTGGELVVCDHANVTDCRIASCPGVLESARWATSIRSPHGEERTRNHRGLILVVRFPPSWPSWAAYQDTDRRVYVNGGQAVSIRDAERRAVATIDDDFLDIAPPCLAGMGCLCAGHARGDAPQVQCDTSEQPGARPKPADDPRARDPIPQCAQADTCRAAVTHIDEKGFVYCAPHGTRRKAHCRCRKLRPHELRKIERRESLKGY